MRKVAVGLLGLSLTATGLVVGHVRQRRAARRSSRRPPRRSPSQPTPDHDLPNPLEDKRRALRRRASARSSPAGPRRRRSTAAPSSRSARPPAAPRRGRAGTRRPARPDQGPVRRAGPREDRQDLRRCSPSSATSGTRATRTRTPNPAIPGPDHVRRPAAQRRSPSPTARWTTPPSGSRTTTRPHFQELYFGDGQGRRVAEEVLREAVLGPLQRRRRGHRLGQGHVQRGPLRPQQRLPRAPATSAPTPGTWSRDAANRGSPTRRPRAAPTPRSRPTWQSFDQWDRYDFDGDGNFNEPDGYIDHFQIVHAGGDQADGDPISRARTPSGATAGTPSHRHGTTGPAINQRGGTQIGNTGLWVGDYTIQPENGGLSVFAHEYGHDLGLPDDYDTSGGRRQQRRTGGP